MIDSKINEKEFEILKNKLENYLNGEQIAVIHNGELVKMPSDINSIEALELSFQGEKTIDLYQEILTQTIN